LLLTAYGVWKREIEGEDRTIAQAKQGAGGAVLSGSEGFVEVEGEIEAGWGSWRAVSAGW
jgi:hypothetical protein